MISVVINTLNEAANIEACILSIRGLADEIIVCDMYSDDRTVEIATRLEARVLHHERTEFVEPARRFAITNAKYDWVLVLDADERMTGELAEKLREVSTHGQYDVVSFWSLYWYFGDWVYHGAFYTGKWRRFFRKSVYVDRYSQMEERIHGNFSSLAGQGNVLQLPDKFYIKHYAYSSIEKYVSKTLGKYARIEGEQYIEMGRRFSLLRMLGEPVKEIVSRFFLRRGYKDGTRGLILALLYAGYRFSVWANVWYLQEAQKNETEVL